MKRLPASAFRQDTSGSTAMEFAFILPVFVMMILGIISCAQLGSAVTSMNFAVQEAARCYALNSTLCGSSNAVAMFAQARYTGPDISPTFSANASGCGRIVTSAATYRIDVLFFRYDVPLSASACFPAALT